MDSFNLTHLTEILNLYQFRTLSEARKSTKRWLIEYNNQRPHAPLNNLIPEAYWFRAE
ncbi:integrase core domain-containing protein [Rouxiella badensis]|uniref:integrase core domain-containing protein n=1 Tax=Rouxiella badensis TaxID=1646377 RepID=UPI003A5B9497